MFNKSYISSLLSSNRDKSYTYSDKICDTIEYREITGYRDVYINTDICNINIYSDTYNNFKYIYASPVYKQIIILNLMYPIIKNKNNNTIIDKRLRNHFIIRNIASKKERISYKESSKNWCEPHKPCYRDFRVHHIMNKVFNNELSHFDVEVVIPNKSDDILGYHIMNIPIDCEIYKLDDKFDIPENDHDGFNKDNHKGYIPIHKFNSNEQKKILKTVFENFNSLENSKRLDILDIFRNLPNGLVRDFSFKLAEILHRNGDDRMYLLDYGSLFKISNYDLDEVIKIVLENYDSYTKNASVIAFLNRVAGSINDVGKYSDDSNQFMSEVYWKYFILENNGYLTNTETQKDKIVDVRCNRKFIHNWLKSYYGDLNINKKQILGIIYSSIKSDILNYNYNLVLIGLINGQYSHLVDQNYKKELIQDNRSEIKQKLSGIKDNYKQKINEDTDDKIENINQAINTIN